MSVSLNEELKDTYSEIEEIGSGGGGIVFKAYHKGLQKYVVLKKMRSQVKGILNERTETDTLKNLHHTYLPQVYNFFKSGDDAYTVMDFIEGKSFEQLIKEKHKFTKKQVLKYTQQLCEAMAYLHKQTPPVMHGDIKPANIMLKPDDNICLIDFNISGFLSDGDMITVGYSAGYASPEQCQAVQSLKNVTLDKQSSVTNKQIGLEEDATLLSENQSEEETEIIDVANENMTVMSNNKLNEETTILFNNEEDKTELLADYEAVEMQLQQDKAASWKSELLEQDAHSKKRESVIVDNSALRIDLRADVYSIGATLYHLATGIRPNADTEKNLPVEEVTAEYSNGFSVIISKAMERDPDKRFKDAEEMLRAVKNMHKYDKSYKALLIKQEVVFLLMMLFVGSFLLLFFSGKQRMKLERNETYETMIEQLVEARMQAPETFEILYDKARSFMPQRLDADYQKAVLLAEQGQYEEDITFITEHLLNESNLIGQDFADDVYYILADCYFELEAYKEAVVYYKAAVDLNGQVSLYYGDYAIALVYCGRIDNAEEILRRGRENGMATDYVLLASAEIESAKGKYDEAEAHFQECIQTTANEEIRLRAYVLYDKTLRKQENSEEILLQSVDLLIRAQTELEMSNHILILERLAQDYIDLSALSGDLEYDRKALAVLDKIVQHGWDNKLTHLNRAILYEKLGTFEEAEEILRQLAEEDPENYVFFKRLAILEIDMQSERTNEERNYGQFLQYYDKTIELYEKAGSAGNDIEIQWLEQAREELEDGGWLEE